MPGSRRLGISARAWMVLRGLVIGITSFATIACGAQQITTSYPHLSKPLLSQLPRTVDLSALANKQLPGLPCAFKAPIQYKNTSGELTGDRGIDVNCRGRRYFYGVINDHNVGYEAPQCLQSEQGRFECVFAKGSDNYQVDGSTEAHAVSVLVSMLKLASAAGASPSSNTSSGPGRGQSGAHLSATDAAGDNIAFTISVGSPVAANTVSDPAVAACASDLNGDGSTLARSAAIPVTVTSNLQSNSGISAQVDFGEDLAQLEARRQVHDALEVIDPRQPNPAPLTLPYPLWATTYSTSGPQCTSQTESGAGVWAALTEQLSPGQAQTWQSWLVVPEQITPASPPLSSPDSAVGHFAFYPRITIGQYNASVSDTSPSTDDYLTCSDGKSYVVANRTVAVTDGCS